MPRSRRQAPRIPRALRQANKMRGERARRALDAYLDGQADDESNLTDLFTDFRHLLGPDAVDEAAIRSKYHYVGEAVCPDDIALADASSRAVLGIGGITGNGSKPRRKHA